MKKIKKIAIGVLTATALATSAACINASAYSFVFSLGMGEVEYTEAHSRGTADNGAIQVTGGTGSTVYLCFCQSPSYAQVSYSVAANTTSLIRSWYYAGSYYDQVCLRATNGQYSRTLSGYYNPNGNAM